MINYDEITPIEVFKKFPEFRKRMLENKILKFEDDENSINWKTFVIPSFKCRKRQWEKQFSLWFPYYHQVFWFLLQELKDVKFALLELERIAWDIYTFPNWNIVELESEN